VGRLLDHVVSVGFKGSEPLNSEEASRALTP
jgi:hypothetical protein